jgi:hypothetical protein
LNRKGLKEREEEKEKSKVNEDIEELQGMLLTLQSKYIVL